MKQLIFKNNRRVNGINRHQKEEHQVFLNYPKIHFLMEILKMINK